jgi:toxin ParE1/3/4
MTDLRLTAQARQDLEDIQAAGLRDHGNSSTRNHMAGFERVFDLLREHPNAGQARSEYGPNFRSFSYHPHRIFYRSEAGGVLIVRILHAARDVADALRRH